MPVYDEMEWRRQKAVIRWLTVVWLMAIAYFVTSYYGVDSIGSRVAAKWDAIRNACLLATLVYALLLTAALWRWPAGRFALLVVSAVGTVCLGYLAIGFTVLFAWIWNPLQYLCLVLGTFAVFRLTLRCGERIPDARRSAGVLRK